MFDRVRVSLTVSAADPRDSESSGLESTVESGSDSGGGGLESTVEE